MGLFNKLKDMAKAAQDAVDSQAQTDPNTFIYQGHSYPLPPQFVGIDMQEWFYWQAKMTARFAESNHLGDAGQVAAMDEAVRELGFQNHNHWATYCGWAIDHWTSQTGEDRIDLEMRESSIAQERIMAEQATQMRSEPGGGELAPVEGISLEQWATVNAQTMGGGDPATVIAAAGIAPDQWERVNAEWMRRMQNDTSMTITTVYSNAFAAASQGQFGAHGSQAAAQGVGGDVGAEPIPFERYIEIGEAMSAAASQGRDAVEVLASFGMTVIDWSNVGMYWSKREQQDAMMYYELRTELSAKYRAQYGG